MVERPSTTRTACYLFFGIFFCAIALAATAISFATDQWINCEVKHGFADSWWSNPLYNCTYCPEMFYSRNRGLFRTCYTGSGVQWIKAFSYLERSLVDSSCLAERGYQVSPGDPSSDDYGQFKDFYEMRIHMMHAQWSLFLAAIVLSLVSLILGVVGCWLSKNKDIIFATVLMLLTALSTATGMGLFHGYYDLEKNKIIQAPMYGLVLNDNSYVELRKVTSCGFGFSYGLGWVALIASTISFGLFLSVAIKVCLNPRPSSQHKQLPRFVQSEPPKEPPKPLTQQGLIYRFFDNAARHSNQPAAYPIPFNPYDLHIPTGISSNELRFPNYGQMPGRFHLPMMYSNTRINY